MSDEKYRIWALSAPFTKSGWPVVGNFGASVQPVVIMTTETFSRLVKVPGLEKIVWEVGRIDG